MVISNITVPMRGRSLDRGRGRGTAAKEKDRQEDTASAPIIGYTFDMQFQSRGTYCMIDSPS